MSEEGVKTSIPGILQVKRFENSNKFVGDLVYDLIMGSSKEQVDIRQANTSLKTKFPLGASSQDLLVPVLRKGQSIYQDVTIKHIRNRVQHQLSKFKSEIKSIGNPEHYPVSLDFKLHQLKKNFFSKA